MAIWRLPMVPDSKSGDNRLWWNTCFPHFWSKYSLLSILSVIYALETPKLYVYCHVLLIIFSIYVCKSDWFFAFCKYVSLTRFVLLYVYSNCLCCIGKICVRNNFSYVFEGIFDRLPTQTKIITFVHLWRSQKFDERGSVKSSNANICIKKSFRYFFGEIFTA